MYIPLLKSLNPVLILLLLLTFNASAQYGIPVTVRPCGTDRLLEQKRKDPAFLAKERAINQVLLQQHYKTVSGTAEPDGKRAPIATYVYFATIEYKDGSTQTIKGTVVVVR
jgi:hypothetical protein